MNVLLAIDGSPGAGWACEALAGLPGMATATIHLIHVTEPIPEPIMPFPDVFMEHDLSARERIEQAHEIRAERRLESLRDALPANWRVIPQACVGHPAQVILEQVTHHRIDLVVMGAVGIDAPPLVSHGGVTHKVARYAPCPVLVVRANGTRFRHALVALDNGPHAPAVYRLLTASPWLAGCALTVAHVVEDRYLEDSHRVVDHFPASRRYLEHLREALVADGRAFADTQAQALRNHGFKVDALVAEGDPARVIQERADSGRFDLVIMGSRGRHGLGRFRMGSTSMAVLAHTHATILLVRPGPARDTSNPASVPETDPVF